MPSVFVVFSLLAALGFPFGPSLGLSAFADTVIVVDNLTVREPIPGQQMTAAYFDLRNDGDVQVTLVAVSADFARRVEMHETRRQGGTMQMREIAEVLVAPGEQVSFTPGGLHLMIMGVDAGKLRESSLTMDFHFQDGSQLVVEASLSRY